MPFKWKREDTEKLVALIRNHECIYYAKSPDYLDRTKKAQAFGDILLQMQREDSRITTDDIKKKWKNLRIQFMAEQRLIAKSKESAAAGTSEIYESKLWCYDQLSFLTKHSQFRNIKRSRETIEESNETFSDDGLGNAASDCTDEPPINMEQFLQITEKCDCSYSKEAPTKRIKSETHHFQPIQKDFSDSNGKKYSWLGALVTNQMEEINPEDQSDAAWQIQCFMQELIQKARNKWLPSTSESATTTSSTEYILIKNNKIIKVI